VSNIYTTALKRMMGRGVQSQNLPRQQGKSAALAAEQHHSLVHHRSTSIAAPDWLEGFDPVSEWRDASAVAESFEFIILTEEDDGTARLSLGVCIHDCLQEDYETMTLLIPDRDRENQDDFIWCVPVERQKWKKWYALSEKFKTAVPKEHGGCRYMNRMEGRHVKTVLVMPNEEQSDDDAVTACAFLRMVKGLTCRMYIVRCTDDPLTGARLINKAAGANVSLVEDVEFTDEGCTTNEA